MSSKNLLPWFILYIEVVCISVACPQPPPPPPCSVFNENSRRHLKILKNSDLWASITANLEVLSLVHCPIKEIEKGAFRGANKVTELNLGWNQIEELDLNVFEDLPSLQKLWLNSNPLTSFLYDSKFPHSNITLLSFSYCRLRSINTGTFENLVNLKELHIDGNQLSTLDWKIFQPLKNLQMVYLYENPFHCDCKVKLLLEYLGKRNIDWNLSNIRKPSCSSSSFRDYISQTPSLEPLNQELIGVDWKLINRRYLVCPPQVDSLQKIESLEKHISLDCKYSGHPQPNVTWRIDGKELKIDNSNKNLIQTRKAEGVSAPEYNYEFIQTLFINLLPYYTNSSTVKVTCQTFIAPFASNESDAVSVKLLNMETTSVINEIASKTLVENNASLNISKPVVKYSPEENHNLSKIILIFGAVTGFVLIIVGGAVIITARCRKHVPFYHFLPQRDHRPPVEDNPTGHVYDYIRMSWIHRQDGDGYETPISLSIQHVPLPPLPQQHNPEYEVNKT